MSTSKIEKHVDRLFKENCGKDSARIPVVGGYYVPGEDEERPLKKKACAALAAIELFAENGPADAQPLPVPYHEEIRPGHYEEIIRMYSCSLSGRGYDIKEHPSFSDYVSGVLWEMKVGGFAARPCHPNDVLALEALEKRFPPRMLEGMGPSCMWEPPELHAKTMEQLRRSRARKAA